MKALETRYHARLFGQLEPVGDAYYEQRQVLK